MTRLWAVALFAVAVTAGADSNAAFDPEEKISLDLKNAKLTDVIATLGAMANLPVVIAPGLETSVSLRVKETTFEGILESSLDALRSLDPCRERPPGRFGA